MKIGTKMTTGLAAIGVLTLAGVCAGEATSNAEPTPDAATAYQEAWGPPVGSTIPPIATADQQGAKRDLASLTGERGLLLLVNRSTVW